ncbi:MAG: mechanosensitive ion channel family protein [Alphaproteobacteria bacterium]
MDDNLSEVSKIAETVIDFGIEYGFQILGAIVVLVIGLKLSSWAGGRVTRLCEAKNIDVTLSRFIGNVVKIVLVVTVAIITLGNFGITIAPFIALAGASAFGATMALQGPLSNYGAGLSIILSRPFVVGDTINVQGVSGVVHEITLAQTYLYGEDNERISVPNKEVVGQVIVNSNQRRVVQTKILVADESRALEAINAITRALDEKGGFSEESKPLVGIHDFTYGGIVIGVRYWVESSKYFASRYAANRIVFDCLREAGIDLVSSAGGPPGAVMLDSLSADDDTPGHQEPVA